MPAVGRSAESPTRSNPKTVGNNVFKKPNQRKAPSATNKWSKEQILQIKEKYGNFKQCDYCNVSLTKETYFNHVACRCTKLPRKLKIIRNEMTKSENIHENRQCLTLSKYRFQKPRTETYRIASKLKAGNSSACVPWVRIELLLKQLELSPRKLVAPHDFLTLIANSSEYPIQQTGGRCYPRKRIHTKFIESLKIALKNGEVDEICFPVVFYTQVTQLKNQDNLNHSSVLFLRRVTEKIRGVQKTIFRPYYFDSYNQSPVYLNKIKNKVLPYLKNTFFPLYLTMKQADVHFYPNIQYNGCVACVAHWILLWAADKEISHPCLQKCCCFEAKTSLYQQGLT